MADSASEQLPGLFEKLGDRLAKVLYPEGGRKSDVTTSDMMLDTLYFDRPNALSGKAAEWFADVLGPVLSSDVSDEQKVSALKQILAFDVGRNPKEQPAHEKYGKQFENQFGTVKGRVGSYDGKDVYAFEPNANTATTGGFAVPGHDEFYINSKLGMRQSKMAHEGTHTSQYQKVVPQNLVKLQAEREDARKVAYFDRLREQMAREAENAYSEVKPEFRYMYEQMKQGPMFKNDLLEVGFPTQPKVMSEEELALKRMEVKQSIVKMLSKRSP